MPLTPGQERVLLALREVTADGWPASIEEITCAAGLASKSTTFVHLLNLIEAGKVEKHPRWHGGYRVAHGV